MLPWTSTTHLPVATAAARTTVTRGAHNPSRAQRGAARTEARTPRATSARATATVAPAYTAWAADASWVAESARWKSAPLARPLRSLRTQGGRP
eukprot:3139743-Prymnesium_polylepis.2